jgi:hypothetical protein
MFLNIPQKLLLNYFKLRLTTSDVQHHLVPDIQLTDLSYLLFLNVVNTIHKFVQYIPNIVIAIHIYTQQLLQFGYQQHSKISVPQLAIFSSQLLILEKAVFVNQIESFCLLFHLLTDGAVEELEVEES